MTADNTHLTSANSVLTLSCPGVLVAATKLQGFGIDKAFMAAAADLTQAVIGVDGKMSAGFVPALCPLTITLLPNSPSKQIFDQIRQFQITARRPFYMTLNISLPSTGESYVWSRGVILRMPPMPTAQNMLQQMDIETTWESVNRSLI